MLQVYLIKVGVGHCWRSQLSPMFCWETLGLGIHVDVTSKCTTHVKIVSDDVNYSIAVGFPEDNGLFQQDDAPCHTANIVQDLFEEHG